MTWPSPGWKAIAQLFAAAALLIGPSACAPAPRGDAPAAVDLPPLTDANRAAAADQITAEAMLRHIAELSADDMEGRGPGTAGDAKARRYIIDQLSQLGVEPAGPDGSWEQPFDIVGVTAEAPKTWRFEAGGQSLELDHWDEFIAFSGVQAPEAAVQDAELVFVGYGIEAPEYGWDDFAGVDVRGKVLLMLNNDPDWDPELFEGDRRLYYGRWGYKYEQAAKHGAAGAIIHHTRPSAGYPWGVVQASWTGPQFELPYRGEPRIQVAGWTVEDATRRLVALGGHDLDRLIESARSPEFEPVPLGVTTSIRLTNQVETTQTANVLGRLPGSDPAAADEAVIWGAHHDHLGVGKPDDSGDAIYNGALDNASGVAALIEAARAYQALPRQPRRSTIFAFWAAEEQGLLGSRLFAEQPTLPAGRMAANLNVDGANIWGRTRDVVFIGYGKSDLDALVERHAASQGRHVVGDQFPDRGFFYRSDQFRLAKIGVPAVYLDAGVEFIGQGAEWGRQQMEAWEGEKYHQPGDELEDDWNLEGTVEDIRLLFGVGVDVGEADALPAWKPGDEFEAARQAALEALP